MGLMRFDQDSGGGIIDVPIGPISVTGSQIRDTLDLYYAQGGTPLEESMYEAARYYRGDEWYFGKDGRPNNSVATSLAADGKTYISPITATCQKNHIILLTDGEPTNDTGANSLIQSWITTAGLSLPDGLSSSCSGNGACLDELAYFLQNTDQARNQIGDQGITTYTIGGFGVGGVDLLKRTANWGGGAYYPADDTKGLAKALDSIFLDILSTNTTFTAPAVSVNAFNASEHRDELYYALFRPDENVFWPGNLKKYKLTADGMVVGKDLSTPAISGTTGFFNEGVYDFWNSTNVADGDNIALGGFANLLNAASRNVKTEDNTNQLQPLANVATKVLYNMTAETDETFNKVVQWTLGYDVDDEDGDPSTNTRYAVSDPLHSEPLIITYGGTDTSPDASLFFGTNEGFLHVLNANTGEEQFAFIPSELLKNQQTFYENNTAASERPYGMDGFVSTWINDKNENNVIYNSSGALETGEHVYVYVGMRRGGSNYYALDVTDRTNPKLKFVIKGGQGNFTKLGQTWSKAIVTKAKLPGDTKERVVLIFSGGYDTNQDSNNTRADDTIGNAIYMVDATTGERLWWASNTGANLTIANMKNSIPASPTPVDINADGLVDYLFAADTGGRIFRIDFDNNASTIGNFAKGDMIADLSGTERSNNRRFYNQPSVSLVKDKQLGDYLSIAIGSGHRAHPIFTTEVKNRMYVIKDRSPYKAPTTYVTVTEAAETETGSSLEPTDAVDKTKVYNATSLMTGGTAALTSKMKRLMTEGGGFYVTFSTTGEKVLSRATTFSGAVLFTTFSPSGTTTSECGPDTGQSRIYAIDQKWGIPVLDLDNDGEVDIDDASTTLAHAGIAPRPVVIYRTGGKKTIAIGTETVEDHRFDPNSTVVNKMRSDDQSKSECHYTNCNVRPIYWRQNEKDFTYQADPSGE